MFPEVESATTSRSEHVVSGSESSSDSLQGQTLISCLLDLYLKEAVTTGAHLTS